MNSKSRSRETLDEVFRARDDGFNLGGGDIAAHRDVDAVRRIGEFSNRHVGRINACTSISMGLT